jgi:hypothetical protein
MEIQSTQEKEIFVGFIDRFDLPTAGFVVVGNVNLGGSVWIESALCQSSTLFYVPTILNTHDAR